MMDRTLLEAAAQAIRVVPEEAEKHCRVVPEINGYYCWNPVRGGLSVLINADGERLIATSSVSFAKHLDTFLSGRRN